MAARIVGLGKHLPDRVLTNVDLESMVETSDDWIVARTGIRERRIVADDESAATLGAAAARMALETAGASPESVDLIICATCTGDGIFPATASLIQDEIGARHAGAFDINAACTGFITGLATATQFINAGVYERVLVVGAEVFSRIVDWTDRSTCVLFGDGAGAALLERSDRGGPISFVLKSDGSQAETLFARGPGSRPGEDEAYVIRMDGGSTFKFAVRAMEDAARMAIEKAGLTIDDISLVVPHQANQRIMSAIAKNLGLPDDRLFSNIERYGNTSAASIPVALTEAWEAGRLHEGDHIALVAFGGGLAWGASVVEWARIGCE